MHVRNEELRTTRELSREVASCVEALKNGDVDKLVITQGGKMVAVMVSPEKFEDLLGWVPPN